VVATAVTVIALPSLWLMSRSGDSGAPNVATAGVALEAAGAGPSTSSDPFASASASEGAPAAAAVVRPDVMGTAAPATVGATVPEPPPTAVQIAVPPGTDASSLVGSATFRSSISSVDLCFVRDAPFGTLVTVTNRNNGRSVGCRASVSPIGEVDDIVLHADAFAQIADPTDAPIPVEIDW
jgi:hypothetical protein